VLEGRLPRKADAVVAKNFLFKDELYVLHLMCEQFLLFAESKALRGQALTMKELTLKLDQLFAINEYPVFNGYGDFLRDKAKEHAEIECHLLMDRVAKGEHLPAAALPSGWAGRAAPPTIARCESGANGLYSPSVSLLFTCISDFLAPQSAGNPRRAFLREAGAGGSNPLSPTIFLPTFRRAWLALKYCR